MKKQFIILLILTLAIGLVPANFSNAASLSSKLKGKILLQVESKGEAWYINPENEKRYYLGRPADAFHVMRELGLGISNRDFNSFNGKAPSRLSGKILLKVEDNGKAYYINPVNLKMYFLGKPADAFKVMRELGLGITDKDLSGITSVENIDSNQTIKTLETTEYKNINDFLGAVGQLSIYVQSSPTIKADLIAEGSGYLLKRGDKYYVATNFHVVNFSNITSIMFSINDNNEEFQGWWSLDPGNINHYNNKADYAEIELKKQELTSTDIEFPDISELNYIFNKTKFCESKMPIGSEVFTIGYPKYSQSAMEVEGTSGTMSARILTNGIISGYDKSSLSSFSNYYTTATIDSGNSGGLALSKIDENFCILGQPTWVSTGNYANQGIIQNIYNVYNGN